MARGTLQIAWDTADLAATLVASLVVMRLNSRLQSLGLSSDQGIRPKRASQSILDYLLHLNSRVSLFHLLRSTWLPFRPSTLCSRAGWFSLMT